MVIDHWIFRRGKIDIALLYDPEGPQVSGGFSVVGLVSFFAGIIGEYIISASRGAPQVYFNFIPVPSIELAWYYGFFISAIVHLTLSLGARGYVMPGLKVVARATAPKVAAVIRSIPYLLARVL